MNEETINTVGSVEPAAPSYTVMWDWAWMSGAPDQAKVYYWALRSFLHEKDKRNVVEVSDGELAELLQRSPDAVGRARKKAEEHGLVTVLEEQRRHGYTNGIKHSLPVLRRIRVQVQPPEDYTGPTNPFEARDTIRARQDGSADLRNRNDQATVDNLPPAKSTYRDGSADLPSRGADLPSRGADLPNNTPSDQGKGAPQVSNEVSIQPTSARGRAEAGWLEGQQDSEGEDGASSPAEDVRDRAHALLDGLVMPKGEQYRPQRADIGKVAEALEAGVDPERIETAILSGLEGAERPAAVVGTRCRDLSKLMQSSTTHSGSQGSTVVLPEWCGQCDGQQLAERFVERDGRRAHCECHPNHPSRRASTPAAPSPAEQADPHGVLAQAGITG